MLEPITQRRCRVRILSRFLGVLALVSGLFLSGGHVVAHPHVWIELETRPVMDSDGRVEGLEVYWQFDPFYTVFAVDDMRTDDGGIDEEKLLALGRSNLENLRPFDYFTDLRFNGGKLEIATVDRFETGFEAGKLWMRFIIPLATPIDPRAGSFSYAVFDPTYYIDISYAEPDHARLDNANGCRADVEEAAPTFEAISLAQALDQNTTGPDTLGEMFAQRVRLECS